MIYRHQKSSAGGIVIETVLVLPIFIAGIFLYLWWSYMTHAKAAFQGAVDHAARLAVTRGDFDKFPTPLFTGMTSLRSTGTLCGAGPGNLGDGVLYSYPWTSQICSHAEGYYSMHTQPHHPMHNLHTNCYPSNVFQDLPETYVYTLLFVGYTLKESVGPTVRYPCDPYGSGPNDGEGCLMCKFLHPENATIPLWNCAAGADGQLPEEKISIECHYRPKSFLMTTISSLLGGGPNNMGVWVRRGSHKKIKP